MCIGNSKTPISNVKGAIFYVGCAVFCRDGFGLRRGWIGLSASGLFAAAWADIMVRLWRCVHAAHELGPGLRSETWGTRLWVRLS